MLCFVSATRAKVCPLLHCGTNNSNERARSSRIEKRHAAQIQDEMLCRIAFNGWMKS